MSTSQEMRAIAATFSAQGVQETFPLTAAGYREVPAHMPKYKPLPTEREEYSAAEIMAEPETDAEWLRNMTNRYGHCGQ